MTFEERLKAALGDLQFALIAQVQQSDELRARLAQAEALIPKKATDTPDVAPQKKTKKGAAP